MPPKQRITKDMILEHSLMIAEKEGLIAVTSRSVAKSLGCSVQPVFSQFPTMEDLRHETFVYACSLFVQEILAFEQQSDFFPQVTKWVINLARKKPNLFRLLYLSDEFEGNSFLDMMMSFESNQKIILKMTELYSLDESICKDILLRCCLFLIGTGTMICVNHMDFSDAQVADMMKRTVTDMINGAKGVNV